MGVVFVLLPPDLLKTPHPEYPRDQFSSVGDVGTVSSAGPLPLRCLSI